MFAPRNACHPVVYFSGIQQRALIDSSFIALDLRRIAMPCLFNHRWIFDFRLHYVYRKCRFCNVAERHLRYKESVDMEWEPVRVRTCIESEQSRIVQKRSPVFVRLARSLGITRNKTSDGTKTLA